LTKERIIQWYNKLSHPIFEHLISKDVKIKEDVKLSALTPIRIGGNAKAVVYPKSIRELIYTVCSFLNGGIEFRVVGRMSNLLPPDGMFGGAVIKTDDICFADFDNNRLRVGAGVSLPYLARLALGASLSGLEQLHGIPASVGGALYGNAGAFGREIAELVEEVEILDLDCLHSQAVRAGDIEFGYRSSSLKTRNWIILSALFRLAPADTAGIVSRTAEYASIRKRTQPTLPSLGSTFKRIKGKSAAGLIEASGLKGYCIGGAEISRVHAGFIVNAGCATAADYRALADYARDTVYKRFGVTLENEVEYL